ncbi:MAG: hypothetical protein AAB637_01275 [Patescibacteria group bacterium]
MSNYYIKTKNIFGVNVIFTEKQREEKMLKHPELRQESFADRIKKTIENPDFIYQDLSDKRRSVYYSREYAIDSKIVYTKIILKNGNKECFVITAYRPDYVKERSKTKLLYGKDNE